MEEKVGPFKTEVEVINNKAIQMTNTKGTIIQKNDFNGWA